MALTDSKLKAFVNSGYTESEIRAAYSKVQNQPSRRELSLAECRELGIPINGEMVISVGQPRRKSCP